MSVRMKITHSKTAGRRSHHRAVTFRAVATADGVHRRHFMDPTTGMYRGKRIIVAEKAAKAESAPVKKRAAEKKAGKTEKSEAEKK